MLSELIKNTLIKDLRGCAAALALGHLKWIHWVLEVVGRNHSGSGLLKHSPQMLGQIGDCGVSRVGQCHRAPRWITVL